MTSDMSDYVDVAERIREFRDKFPDGTLQSELVELPAAFAGSFIAVKAYAYRTADDARPGVGLAFEPLPGKTSFTKDSELQNAETSAWGRAIVAVGAADTKRGLASGDEVRNRKADQEVPDPTPLPPINPDQADALRARMEALAPAQLEACKAAWVAERFVKVENLPVDRLEAASALVARFEAGGTGGPEAAPDAPGASTGPDSGTPEPAPPVVPPDMDPSRDPLDGFSKDDLIGACRLNDLDISGTKDALAGRLAVLTDWKLCGIDACPLAASNEYDGTAYCPEHSPL